MMMEFHFYWRRLIISPTRSNELLSIELSWAWEPTYRKRACGNHTGKRDPSVVFLAETLADDVRLEIVQRSVELDHRWVVPREGRGGGLALFWKSSINLTAVGSSKYYIDAVIDKDSDNEWHLTSFYCEPETARRSEAWDQLRYLNSQTNTPWLCVRDFNEIIR